MRRRRDRAADTSRLGVLPKSVELEMRIARLEQSIKDVKELTAGLATRATALQAQLDHILARLTTI